MGEEMVGWYIRRAYHNFRQAKNHFNLYNNVESVIASYEAIEFSIKAMCKLLKFHPKRKHFADADTLSILAKKVEREGLSKKERILKVIPTILSYTEQLRNIARYGVEKADVPSASPSSIFGREYATSALLDAQNLHDLLGSIEIMRRWSPKIKLAILNGFVTGVEEKKCSRYPFTNNDPNFWKKKLQQLNATSDKFEIREINATQISEEFALVLNPFGEEYPEIDLKNKSVFYLIKDYVEDGGVYVNTAGFPFFYGWHVKEGKEYPICESRILIPQHTRAEGDGIGISEVKMRQYLEFTGTLFFREFDAMPTPVSQTRQLFQEREDVTKFGDLTKGVGRIEEFRGLPKATKGCIPIVRAKDRISGQVFPICALKRGKGYLLLAGMNTENEEEANLFVRTVDSFCSWITNQL